MISSTVTAGVLAIASAQFCLVWGQSDKVYEAQADFAVNLLQEASKSDESAVISPLSITTVLSMVLAGAEGRTKQQIIDVLAKGVPFPEFGIYMKNLLLNTASSEGEKYMLDIANRVYVQQQAEIKWSYLELMQRAFHGGLRQVDFRQKTAVIEEINGWVANATHNKIKDLVNSDSINSDTVMMLLNAVYFKGAWKMPFNKTWTSNLPFYTDANNEKKLPTMTNTADYPFFTDKSATIVGLPYMGDNVQMFFILPKKRFGLAEVLKNLSGRELLDYIKKASIGGNVRVEIPRFNLGKKLNLVETLKKLGMIDLFNENADLRFVSESPLSVSSVTHKAFIEVNEEGTEAAAATEAGYHFRSLPVRFTANQPFLFAVVKDLKTILFAGRFAG